MSQSLLGNKKLNNLLEVLNLAPRGAIAEVGVYKGGTLIEIAKARPESPVLGFDTFEGLPPQYNGEDEIHKIGEFKATFDEVIKSVQPFENIYLVKGIFPDSGIKHFPDQTFAFVHLDIDQWRGTKQALNYLCTRMDKGGIILFDDYGWRKCPGIKDVVTEFAKTYNFKVTELDSFQAYIQFNLE